jgi:hypothetical protein
MIGHGEKLSRKWEIAIAALLSESTQEAAAKKAGIAHRTLKNWLKIPEFAKTFRQARRDIVDRAIQLLQQTTVDAVNTLKDSMADDKPPAVRLRAAQVILEQALRALELTDLAEEQRELREKLGELLSERQRDTV